MGLKAVERLITEQEPGIRPCDWDIDHIQRLMPLMLEEIKAHRLMAERGNQTGAVLPGDEHSAHAQLCLAQGAIDAYIAQHLTPEGK